MEKPVVFKSGVYDLAGVLHLPYVIRRNRPLPAVVFCHGFTGNKVEAHRIFVKTARALSKYGIISLRFDFRGCGDSSGDFANTTVFGEVKDACNAMEYLCREPVVDSGRIGILGLSLGGCVAAYAAGRDKRVKALALWAPAADLVEEAEQIQTEKEIKAVRRMKAVDYYGVLLGKRFIDEIPRVKPVSAVKGYGGCALIIHGTGDESVPLQHSLKYYDALRGNGCKVKRYLIEGASHVFDSYKWEQEVIRKTLKFFVKNL